MLLESLTHRRHPNVHRSGYRKTADSKRVDLHGRYRGKRLHVHGMCYARPRHRLLVACELEGCEILGPPKESP